MIYLALNWVKLGSKQTKNSGNSRTVSNRRAQPTLRTGKGRLSDKVMFMKIIKVQKGTRSGSQKNLLTAVRKMFG